ncbi:porphyromonas-type peptidyl-arginine deiminase [Trichoderma aethiopicum]
MSDTTFERLAEWTFQKGIIVGWPGLEGYLKEYPERLAKATKEVSSIAIAIAQFEPVTVVVGSERIEEAEAYFAQVDTPFLINVHRIERDSMDVWLRDFGPVFVVKNGPGADRSLVGLDYSFNGWGGRYPTATTVGFAKRLLKDLDIERIETSIVTEGGALETDGDGTLLVTESSIVNENRNPGKSRQEIEDELIRTLGVKKVIWIPGRPGLDSTDCHIDAIVRFVEPGVVLLSKANEEEPTDWTIVYEETLKILSSSLDAMDSPFKIIEVEEPDEDLFDEGGFKGDRAVRSYVNYLLVNGGVIWPRFGDGAHDFAALQLAQSVFEPHRRVYPILIEELPRLGGGIHCTTQEIPLSL